MAAVAHGFKPDRIKGGGPSEKVAQEFNQADKGTKLLSDAMKAKGRGQKKGLASV
jgi:hypothetical protein